MNAVLFKKFCEEFKEDVQHSFRMKWIYEGGDDDHCPFCDKELIRVECDFDPEYLDYESDEEEQEVKASFEDFLDMKYWLRSVFFQLGYFYEIRGYLYSDMDWFKGHELAEELDNSFNLYSDPDTYKVAYRKINRLYDIWVNSKPKDQD